MGDGVGEAFQFSVLVFQLDDQLFQLCFRVFAFGDFCLQSLVFSLQLITMAFYLFVE